VDSVLLGADDGSLDGEGVGLMDGALLGAEDGSLDGEGVG